MTSIDFPSQAAALIGRGAHDEALALARRCASLGSADAQYQLAIWHIVGSLVPRDLLLARKLLADAAVAGHADAGRTLAAMLANGSGRPADWPGALNLIRRLAPSDPRAARDLRLIEAMDLAPDGGPAEPITGIPIDAGGLVRRFPSLFSPAECDHVVGETHDHLAPALVVDPSTGRQIRNPIRSADAMVVSPIREDIVLRALSLRLAAASATDVNQGEAISVMRYRPGQAFKLHHDTLDGTSNQRVVTMLVYLNDDFDGGETVFPHLDLIVRPRKGDAILFDNIRDGRRLDKVQHAGLTVMRGEKWLLSRWIREAPFSLWQGPERPIRQS